MHISEYAIHGSYGYPKPPKCVALQILLRVVFQQKRVGNEVAFESFRLFAWYRVKKLVGLEGISFKMTMKCPDISRTIGKIHSNCQQIIESGFS